MFSCILKPKLDNMQSFHARVIGQQFNTKSVIITKIYVSSVGGCRAEISYLILEVQYETLDVHLILFVKPKPRF